MSYYILISLTSWCYMIVYPRRDTTRSSKIPGWTDDRRWLDQSEWWLVMSWSEWFSLESRLVSKTHTTFLTNQKQTTKCDFGRTHFPTLGAGDMWLLHVLVGSLQSWQNFSFGSITKRSIVLLSTFAIKNPSENSMISQICCKSGTIHTTGLKRAFTLSGSSVRPA